MDNNATQVAIVDGASLYIFNTQANTFTTISSSGWRGSDDVVEIDGYFIFVDPDSDQFYLSAIDDGTSLDALDFSSADSSPDNIVTHRASHRQLWLFGALSTEIWVDSGDLSFPFVRYASYTLDVGCVGKRAAVNAADTLFWVGQTERGSGIVYMAQGNQPTRISTSAVEEALRGSTDISAAVMCNCSSADPCLSSQQVAFQAPDALRVLLRAGECGDQCRAAYAGARVLQESFQVLPYRHHLLELLA